MARQRYTAADFSSVWDFETLETDIINTLRGPKQSPYLYQGSSMTEQEWQTLENPLAMFRHLLTCIRRESHSLRYFHRKFILFSQACNAQLLRPLSGYEYTDDHLRFLLSMERFEDAEGVSGAWAAEGSRMFPERGECPNLIKCAILRDLFGTTFPISPAIWCRPSWFSENVIAIARFMFYEGNFDSVPILCDALEESECYQWNLGQEFLDHFRNPEIQHFRGCKYLDLILDFDVLPLEVFR